MNTLLLVFIAAVLVSYALYQLAPSALIRGRAWPRPIVGSPAQPRTSNDFDHAPSTRSATITRSSTPLVRLAARVNQRLQAIVVIALLTLSLVTQITLNGHPDLLPVSFVLLCIAGIAAGTLVHLLSAPDTDMLELSSYRSALPLPALLGGGALGIACGIMGSLLVTNGWVAQSWWFAAIGIPVATLITDWFASRAVNRRDVASINRVDFVIMAALFTGALLPRVIGLTASPPFLHGDEASCGLFGRIFISGKAPLLSISWYGLPMFSYAVSGVGMHLLGDNVMGLRLTNALIGSAAIPLTYLLGRELFGRRAGLIGAIILAVTFLHMDLSRDGIHYIQGPTCITLTLYLLIRAVRRGGYLVALLAGICTIIDLQVYWSARVAPLLGAVLLIWLIFSQRRLLLTRLPEILWYATGLLAAGLPVFALFAANPGSFAGHQSEISIFDHNQYMHDWLMGAYQTTDPLTVLRKQAWIIATTFNAHGDTSLQIGWGGALLDTVSAALLPASLILALSRWRRWPYLLFLAWFGAVAGAGVVTGYAPWWPRLSAILPAIALMLGVLLSDLWTVLRVYLRVPSRVVGVAVAGVLCCIAIGNLRVLTWEYPAQARQSDRMEATYIGRFLANAPDATHTVLLSDGSMYVDYEPVRFLAPNSRGCTLMAGQPLSQCPVAGQSHLFILLPGRVADLPWLERQRPGGRVLNLGTYGYGASRVLAYETSAGHTPKP